MRLVIVLLLAVPMVRAEEKTGVRELKVPDIQPVARRTNKPEPVKYTSAADFEKAFMGKGVKEVLKQVDFSKEYIVAFAWAGSGGDQVGFRVDKGQAGEEVTFGYTPGVTDDLRRHLKLFVLPSKATFKMGK